MDAFSYADLKTLIEDTGRVCVSLFLPTHRAGEGTKQDPIRLKNLLGRAETRLAEVGVRAPDMARILQPAVDLVSDGLFWSHQSDGLVIFLADGAFRRYRLPLPVDESVFVSERYHLKPLFPLLTGDGHFYVLALTQKSVRLLEGTRYSVDEIDLAGLPSSLAEALKHEHQESQLQFHTRAPERGGRRAAVFHGHNPAQDQAKDRLRRFFRQLNDGIRAFLGSDDSPLVLAGVDYYFPIYREINDYPHLLTEGVPGSPGELSSGDLHARAWPLVQPHFRKEEDRHLAQYRQLAGSPKVSSDLSQIVSAAHQGRVDVLFVALGVHRWGRFDAAENRVEIDDESSGGGKDLLDTAAIQTVVRGGTVYALEPTRLPTEEPAAAILRY